MKEVVIIFGGDSVENKISKQSAESIFQNIDQSSFIPRLLDIKELKIKSIKKDTIIFYCSPWIGW